MKKFLIILCILFGIVLTGCDQKKGLSQDEKFEKKKECLKLENVAQERLNYLSENQKTFEVKLYEIRYSELLNTCIAGFKITPQEKKRNEKYDIYDLMSKKEIVGGMSRNEYNNSPYRLPF